jgi:uncharacterized cupredoxin-like copper-binding protein
VLVAGLSTGHMIGLALTGGVFIAFALSASFLAPRRWPDFPGKNGLSVFIIASFVLFAAMITAVEVFGVEKSEAGTEAHGAAAKTIDVTESEYKIALPSLKSLAPGTYTFVVKNDGKVAHDLVVGTKTTKLIPPGGTAELTVPLAAGTVSLFCSVDGHRQLGMNATISVA